MTKRGQVGIEYLILIGFVTFAVMVILTFAIFYSGTVQDAIRLNQVESFATKVISAGESVFFAGEPSKSTIRLSLPDGVTDISVTSEGIIFSVQTGSAENVRLFESKVPLSGNIDKTAGIKVITLTATDSDVVIS